MLLAASGLAFATSDNPAGSGDSELGINVYGLSYHFDQALAKKMGTNNQVNPGLGLRYRFARIERWSLAVDAGAYHDSGRNTARLLAGSATWRFDSGWRLGAGLALLNSPTYNRGRPFVAPLPVVSYSVGAVTLNATYFPKISPYNSIPTLGMWLTIWPKRMD